MNIFKKALIVALSVGLISVPTVTKEVEAADTRVIYFNAGGSSLWDQASAKFDAWIWGSSQAAHWIDFVDSDKDGIYESTIPSDATGMKVMRRSPSHSSHSWDNNQKWNNTGDVTIPSDKNCLTITGWGESNWEWVNYTAPTKEYTVTYYDGDIIKETSQVKEKTNLVVSKFFEKEGYRLDGWYLDSALTNKATGTEIVTKNLNLYAKYIESEDYRVYVDDKGKLGGSVYVYTFRSVLGGDNGVWPGILAEKDESNGLWYCDINASQSFDKIIFNNGVTDKDLGKGKEQTVNLDLSYSNTIYTIGVKNEGLMYTATSKLLKFDSIDYISAELGFGYTYDSETNVLQDVTYANLRFSTPKLVATNFDVDSYGMNITLCDGEEDLVIAKEWTNEEVVKSGDFITWSAVVINIPSTYFTTTIMVECFVKVGTYKFVISNTREVTVVGLAQTYIDKHNDQDDELKLSDFELAGCQYIIDSVTA